MKYNQNDVLLAIKRDRKAFENIYIDINNDLYKIALSKLNAKDRMIVSLCIVEGYKSSEVAEVLSMNSSTVRSRLNRSLKKMREYLEVE